MDVCSKRNGSLTNTVYSDGTPTVSLAYDRAGRQVEARDAAGTTTFAYDDFGSLTNETVVGVAGTNSIERFYDSFGRDAGYALNGARQSTLAYDPATGRLASMQSSGTGGSPVQGDDTFTWSYLLGSDLKSSLSYPNGLSASWTYDANNQLLQVCNATPTNVISQYDYTYDAAGRRVACGKSGTAFAHDDTLSYGYNEKSELTNAVAAVDADYHYSYDFDDIGNRESSSERGTNSLYTANQLNQYTAITDVTATHPSSDIATQCSLRSGDISSSQTFQPQFDDDGNQTLIKTATGIWSVTYNGENRPILWENVSTNSPTPNSSTPPLISMSFDRMGRRVTKNAQRFVYDGYLQIANFEIVITNSQLTTHNPQLFVWDPTEPVATRPLVWNRASFAMYYTHDGNKNVSEVIASYGAFAAHYEYAPFGAVTIQFGIFAAVNPWRFSSEHADDELALSYYNYRHYEPLTGRWIGMGPRYDFWNEYCACYNYFFNFDVLGLYRMISGWLYAPKSGTQNALRKRILEEIYYINNIMSPDCYRVRLKDLEYATAKEINDANKEKNTEVLVVGHGHKNPFVGYGLNNGHSIPISELNLHPDNMFGCYISRWVRGESIDDFSVMYKGILARLVELTPKKDKCCEKTTIIIYEGEFSNVPLPEDKLKNMGNEDVDWKWNKVDQKEAAKREGARDVDLLEWYDSDEWKKTHPDTLK